MIINHAICAIGNRACGEAGWRIAGFFLLTIGMWLGHPLWSLPAYLACALAFRMPSTRPWNNLGKASGWWSAWGRSQYVIPMVALDCYFNPWCIFELLLIPAIPLIYYVLNRVDGETPAPEFVAGYLV